MTDDEILGAQRWLATHEGIFVEPASAAPIAGLFKCCEPARNPVYSFARIPEGSRIVCTVTGHGLKDPDVMGDCGSDLKAVRSHRTGCPADHRILITNLLILLFHLLLLQQRVAVARICLLIPIRR